MNMNELIQSTPIAVEKSARSEDIRCITSTKAGYIVPIAFIPLLREDSVTRGDVRVSFDMAETLYPLLNAVNAKVMAHFVSPICYADRFDGLDSFNRSYQGVPEPSTGTPIPFYPTMVFNKAHGVWSKFGVQWKDGTAINSAPVEAYNALVNFRRRARTDKLPERAALDTTLAEAFWKNTVVSDIVPDWDQSALDGEVPLNFVDSKLRVQGLRRYVPGSGTTPPTPLPANGQYYTTNGGLVSVTSPQYTVVDASGTTPFVWGELKDAGVTVSLANIELAKQTAAFAKLRERFDGLDDDHIIDLLMEGIRVPDEALKQPILLDSKSTVFGMEERHAMDGDNLDVSRTTGQTSVNLRFRMPPMNTGGIILITCEIVPEQLYERMRDTFLGTTDPATLPNFMRDFLDPEKVEVVQNQFIDVYHGTPTGVFGYAPLNWTWRRSLTRAGGKFYRPYPDVFVEDRQRFWSADQTNPTLADDFYMVSDLPATVFADTISDQFEIVTLGRVNIVGNTVFGDRLSEDTNAYEDIMDQVDTGRITQTPVPPATLDGGAEE